jgi:diguanylate cyclase (GGDEF)-like protein
MTGNGNDDMHEALESLADLEEAIHAHVEWVNQVHRTLIFHHQPVATISAPDAHLRCAFGSWYSSVHQPEILESSTYRQINLIHQKVHEVAAELVTATHHGQPDEALYEAFTAFVAHLMEMLRRLEGEVWSSISTKDALTGLFNRQAMEAFLKRAGGATPLGSVALCDIDHFKRVNDTYGHQVGDDVLRVVAQCLMHQLRSSDTAYRYGGEEFLLHFAAVNVPTALSICERLREAVATLEIPIGHGQHIGVTLSFGVAPLDASEFTKHAVAKADAALYLAKNSGRNKVCCHAA